MMKKILIVLIFSVLFFLSPINSKAGEKTNIYLFYRDECPHCHEEIKYLESINLDNFNLIKLSVDVKENRKLFEKVQKILNKPANGVPYLLIGGRSVVGFDETITPDIINQILLKDVECDVITSINKNEQVINCGEDEIINYKLPILGEINPKSASLGLVAIIMGFIDGFNPCAMWILIFLISLLIGIKDKKKTIILGSIFIFFSALTYMLFMKSWISISKFLNTLTILKILIGAFAVYFGFTNVKNYFKTRKQESGCEVVDDKKRIKIIGKIKKIVREDKYIFAILGIIVLAMAVNLLELSCSLGLPVIFGEILSINNLSHFKENMYILIYIFFYMIDDLVIFLIAVFTMKVSSVSNKYTKYSHLIGGALMIIIGILMIFKPEWLMLNFK